MAGRRSVDRMVAQSVLRAEQRYLERILRNDFKVDEIGRIRAGRSAGVERGKVV